jgi:hypothetical protein
MPRGVHTRDTIKRQFSSYILSSVNHTYKAAWINAGKPAGPDNLTKYQKARWYMTWGAENKIKLSHMLYDEWSVENGHAAPKPDPVHLTIEAINPFDDDEIWEAAMRQRHYDADDAENAMWRYC